MSETGLVSTHVLDALNGVPAEGISATLTSIASVEPVATGTTDVQGRISGLGPAALPPGHYRVSFDTAGYFAELGIETFYPAVDIVFEILADVAHYHVPLLLSPFAFTTYRGS